MSRQTITEADFRSWNEEMVRKYDPDQFHNHRNPIIRWVETRRVTAILAALNVSLNDQVLEVGCGAGNVLVQVSAASRYGVDISRTVLRSAKRRLGPAGLSLAAGECLPYLDACFDKVYCSEVLEHVLNPNAVIDEMKRVLRPGGTLVLSVPNEKIINRCKSLLSAAGLHRRFFSSGGYESPENMEDEWHIHSFSRDLLHEVIGDGLEWITDQAVPFSALPIRYVATLIKQPEAASCAA